MRTWLLNPENEIAARSYMHDVWQDTPAADSEANVPVLLEKTWQRIARRGQRPVLSRPRMYWRMAAAVLLLAAATASVLYIVNGSSREGIGAGTDQQLSSATGQIIIKLLPDGTKVWLNTRSTIRYAETFSGLAEREVWLEGEAYFDVAEDKQHPFIVHAPGIQVRVLGTAFNVKSYTGDATVETTLVRGKVSLETTGDRAKKIELEPNQQAVFSRASDDLALLNVETGRYTSWISGSLVFEESPVEDVIKALERWYGVTIHLQDQNNLQCRLTARIDKESLTETLELLRSTTGIAYTVQGDHIEIQGTLCNPLNP